MERPEGLGNPVAAPQQNEFVKSNVKLDATNAKITGAQVAENNRIAAEAAKAGEMAGLERGRAEVLASLQRPAQTDPVQELANAIMNQQISQEQLAQIGQNNPELVQAAMQLVQQPQQPAGLGQLSQQDYLV